jgi:hypothetical protein
LKLKEISRASAAEWNSSSSRDKAMAKFELQLRRQEIPDYIDSSVCMWEERGQVRSIWCGYEVDVKYPIVDKYRLFSFEVTTTVNRQGDINQY